MEASTGPRLRVIVAGTQDPYLNLATEDWIYNAMDLDCKVLFLWRNDNTIVIGRGQNAWSECDLDKVRRDGVHLVRRHSGGGAVFQDLGNTCFTFMSAKEKRVSSKQLFARNNEILVGSLRRLGIEAECSGRNDLVVRRDEDLVKISGSAFKESPDRVFHHGTMLLNVDLGRLSQYLTPNKKKLDAKGIKSVRSRVMNLSELKPEIDHDLFCSALIDEFFAYYNSRAEVESLDQSSLHSIETLAAFHENLTSWEWNFGKTPSFQHKMDTRFPWGMMELHINSERGRVHEALAFSDCLEPEFLEHVAIHLKDQPYTPEGLLAAQKAHATSTPERIDWIRDFYNWVIMEL